MPFPISGAAGINLTATYTSGTQPMVIGTTVTASDASEYMFVRATSTIAQYDVCVIYNTSSATGASIGCVPAETTNALAATRLAFAQTAITSAEYGWVALKGNNLRVKALVSCNPKVPIFLTATAGSVDDAIVSAAYCMGVTLVSSATSASAPPCVVGNAACIAYIGST